MSQCMREMVIMARENEEVEVSILKNFEPLMKKCIRIYVRDYSYFEDAMQEARLTVIIFWFEQQRYAYRHHQYTIRASLYEYIQFTL